MESVVGPGSCSKHLNKTCTEKVMITEGRSVARLIHHSILHPRETLTSDKYVRKSRRCTRNCNYCSQHGQQKGPDSSPTTSTSKVE